MTEAIQAVYPKSRLQRCIVHQVRSSTRFVSWKDIKQVVADLKKIYTSVTLDEAEENLLQFSEKWRNQYPSCVKSWDVLSTFYEYPPEVRKIIYTTNIIEGLNRQFRQITKNKLSFTNDDSLRRMLYLASRRTTKRWRTRCQNWDLVLSQFQLMFAGQAVGQTLPLDCPARQGGIHARGRIPPCLAGRAVKKDSSLLPALFPQRHP